MNCFCLKWKNLISKLSLNRKLNFASSKVVFLNSCIEIPTKRQHKMSHMTAMFSLSSLFLTYFLFKWLFSLWLFSLASRWLLFTFQLVFVNRCIQPKNFYWSNCFCKLVYILLIYIIIYIIIIIIIIIISIYFCKTSSYIYIYIYIYIVYIKLNNTT